MKTVLVGAMALLVFGHCDARHARLDAHAVGGGVMITIAASDNAPLRGATLYRSTVNLATRTALNLDRDPITRTQLTGTGAAIQWLDTSVAHNCYYTYYCLATDSSDAQLPSGTTAVSTPGVLLPPPQELPVSLLIDKCAYTLEVRYGGVAVKRYPVNVGASPRSRKLHYDCLSTPEGRYRIAYLKPNSAWHKAYGVSYPNQVDRVRYGRALKRGEIPLIDSTPAQIGGSIQIHGGGIGSNWTWGCIAMRNEDLDELFGVSEIRVGTPLNIVGWEFTRDSLQSPGATPRVASTTR